MRMRPRVTLIFCLAFALAASRGLGAQVTVRGIRGLSFGTVVPGVPGRVLRTDPVNSGQFEIQGPFLTIIRFTLTLPAVLNGPAGATMPVTFATNDAGWSRTNSIADQSAINPHQSHTRILWIGGRAAVFLGGTVSPAVGQQAGSYAGTVVLSVVVL
jgi:hypothetical protein